METADHVFFVIGADNDEAEWRDLVMKLDPTNTTLIMNKIDLLTGNPLRTVTLQKFSTIQTSCLQSETIVRLRDHLAFLLKRELPPHTAAMQPLIANNRQRRHAEDALEALRSFLATRQRDIVLGAGWLRMAASSIGRITGHIDSEHVLDALFAKFCIGK